MSLAERRLLVREATISTALAATLAALLLWATPPGIDWAAHAYQRTFLLQHGFAIWNNFWYAGRYSFVTYSVLYYPLAALLGIRVLALASVATASFAFSIVVFRQWGTVSRLSSRSFAVLWVGIIGAAAFPFALAMSFALLALWALQERRRGRFALCAALTLAASPLGFAFLVVVLAGVVFARGSLREARVQIAAVAACGLTELILYRLFGGGGRFPYGLLQLAPSVVFGVLGLIVTRGVPQARPLRGVFWTYLAVCIAAYLIPTSVGSNLERLRYVTFQIAASASTDPEAARAYWQPAIHYLHRHLSPSYRVEVVDTAEHWQAAYLPDAGIPIVRGWYRQSDFPQNEVLYDRKLGTKTYETWLRRMGVRYVVLTDAPVDYSARNEAALVRSGRTSLVVTKRLPHMTVYALPKPTPIVTGPEPATVMWLWPQRLVAAVRVPGTYRVRVRWSPYWRSSAGCVSKTADGMTQITTRERGLVELRFGVSVRRGLETLAGSIPACSKTGSR